MHSLFVLCDFGMQKTGFLICWHIREWCFLFSDKVITQKNDGCGKSDSRRIDWRCRKTVKYSIVSPERMPAQSPVRKQARSPERKPAQSPEMKQATSPERIPALNIEKPVQSNQLNKLAQKEKLQSKHEKFQSRKRIVNRTSRTENCVFVSNFYENALVNSP